MQTAKKQPVLSLQKIDWIVRNKPVDATDYDLAHNQYVRDIRLEGERLPCWEVFQAGQPTGRLRAAMYANTVNIQDLQNTLDKEFEAIPEHLPPHQESEDVGRLGFFAGMAPDESYSKPRTDDEIIIRRLEQMRTRNNFLLRFVVSPLFLFLTVCMLINWWLS